MKRPTATAVRRTYSFPPEIDESIARVRKRTARVEQFLNQSEVLRLGLLALDQLTEPQLKELVGSLTRVKPGRKAA